MDIELISQIFIPILSISGMFLVARKNKWGFMLSLLSQPFWFYTAYVNQQWGIFINTTFFTLVFIYGTYNWFKNPPKAVNTPTKLAG